jgi:hypothetical protein
MVSDDDSQVLENRLSLELRTELKSLFVRLENNTGELRASWGGLLYDFLFGAHQSVLSLALSRAFCSDHLLKPSENSMLPTGYENTSPSDHLMMMSSPIICQHPVNESRPPSSLTKANCKLGSVLHFSVARMI